MLEYFRNLKANRTDEGASAVEYGLLVAAIAAVIVAIVFAIGGLINGSFKSTCGYIQTKGASGTGTGSCA